MATLLDSPTLEDKTRELCEFLVESPDFLAAQEKIDRFMEDEEAQGAYRAWQEQGQKLHQLGHQGIEPAEEDVAELERLKKAVMANPVAVEFAQAEDAMNGIFGSVVKVVQKTLQLGHVPTEEDLAAGECCGNSGCGCH